MQFKSWLILWPDDVINYVIHPYSKRNMIHMYTKFNYDTFLRFSVMTKNVNFIFLYEHRGATLRSPYDVMDDFITIKNTFSCIIWDDLFISDIKLKLHVIFWHFQNGRHFYVTTNFLYRKRYRKLTIAEQCPTINPAFIIFIYLFIYFYFFFLGGGGGGGGGDWHWHWWRDVGAHVQKFNLDDTLFLQ